MKHTHMAVGLVPQQLANVAVLVEFTPGICEYTLTLVNEQSGKSLTGSEFHSIAKEAFDYDPKETDLDMAVYRGLEFMMPFPARFARTLAGFAHFKWYSPAGLTRRDRKKFGADQ